LFAGPARAQVPDTTGLSPVADSTHKLSPADSAAAATPHIRIVGERAPAVRDSVRKRPWHEQPRFVMARSLLIPGWGQLHNHSWIKAGLVAAAETWLGVRIVQDQRRLDHLLGDLDVTRANPDSLPASEVDARENSIVNEYNALLDQRLGRQWLLGGVLAYALIDAYVDANFRGFDLEFQHDPALPPGSRPATPADRGSRFGLRVAYRRDF
jgi:hypothetical protein